MRSQMSEKALRTHRMDRAVPSPWRVPYLGRPGEATHPQTGLAQHGGMASRAQLMEACPFDNNLIIYSTAVPFQPATCFPQAHVTSWPDCTGALPRHRIHAGKGNGMARHHEWNGWGKLAPNTSSCMKLGPWGPLWYFTRRIYIDPIPLVQVSCPYQSFHILQLATSVLSLQHLSSVKAQRAQQ